MISSQGEESGPAARRLIVETSVRSGVRNAGLLSINQPVAGGEKVPSADSAQKGLRVPQEGIEPPTLALGVPCSVLLSYWGFTEDYTPANRASEASIM